MISLDNMMSVCCWQAPKRSLVLYYAKRPIPTQGQYNHVSDRLLLVNVILFYYFIITPVFTDSKEKSRLINSLKTQY